MYTQHTKIPVSDEAKANAGHSSKMLTVDEDMEKPMGSYIKDPLPLDEEPYYIDLPGLFVLQSFWLSYYLFSGNT
ncbi:unnamed protein product [Orchesella dallaii]|uniref:Uncharacterized protein n=1 Tax=Orchesella dallaii TaxID=48710 RepID=A0ABP1RAK8_9HEXA